jgi:hypothetical protein
MNNKKPDLVKQSPVERLIHSMESRLTTYEKNKAQMHEEYLEKNAVQDRKIADLKLQIAALKRK